MSLCRKWTALGVVTRFALDVLRCLVDYVFGHLPVLTIVANVVTLLSLEHCVLL